MLNNGHARGWEADEKAMLKETIRLRFLTILEEKGEEGAESLNTLVNDRRLKATACRSGPDQTRKGGLNRRLDCPSFLL